MDREKIIQFNKICNKLMHMGYTIQGGGGDSKRCYISKGTRPNGKIVGYIRLRDNKVFKYKNAED